MHCWRNLCEYHDGLFYMNPCYPNLNGLLELIDNAFIFQQSSSLGEFFKVPVPKIFHFSQGHKGLNFNRWPLLSTSLRGTKNISYNSFNSQRSNFKSFLIFAFLSFIPTYCFKGRGVPTLKTNLWTSAVPFSSLAFSNTLLCQFRPYTSYIFSHLSLHWFLLFGLQTCSNFPLIKTLQHPAKWLVSSSQWRFIKCMTPLVKNTFHEKSIPCISFSSLQIIFRTLVYTHSVLLLHVQFHCTTQN